MTIHRHLGAIAAATFLPAAAGAAPLDLPTLTSPVVEDVVEVSYDLTDLILLGSFAATSSEPVPAAGLYVEATSAIESDGTIGPGGALVVFGGTFELLGELSAFGYSFDEGGNDTLQFLFDVASAPAAFGSRVLATVTGEFGDEATFFSEGHYNPAADLTIAAVVPLPAPALLLGSALLGLRLARRRRS